MPGTVGYGVGASVGIALEDVYGVAETSMDQWLAFTSESIKADRPLGDSGTIYGDRLIHQRLPGRRSGAGDISMEVDGHNIALPMKLWNGKESGALVSQAIPGRVSSAPGGTPGGSGNTLPAGTYRYRVGSIWSPAAGSIKAVLPASAELSGVSVSSGQEVDLTWTDPAGLTPPAGWTYYGTGIYRSEAGGGANSETLRHVVIGTGATYTDTGGSYNVTETGVVPVSGSLYEHTLKNVYVPGSNPLAGFTVQCNKDNDKAELFVGCRMNTFELVFGAGNEAVMAKFGLMARDWEETNNATPTITDLRKFMSWQSMVGINGVYAEIIESITLQGTNNAELVAGNSLEARYRDIGMGGRNITGTFNRSFEDHDYWEMLREGSQTPFDLQLWAEGQLLTAGSSFTAPAKCQAFRYMFIVDVYECAVMGAGSNVGGPGRMVEAVQFGAGKDNSLGTDMRFRLYNLTSSI